MHQEIREQVPFERFVAGVKDLQHLRVDGSYLSVKSGSLAARLEQRVVEARRSALEEVEERGGRAGAGPAAEREAATCSLRRGGEQPEQRETALHVGAAIEERAKRLAREHLLLVVRLVGHRLRVRVDVQLRLLHHRGALGLVGRLRRAIALVLLAAAILFSDLFTDVDDVDR